MASFPDLIEELEQGLLIDENGLEEALQVQPDFFYRVSKEFALVTSRRDAMKQYVDEVKAEADVMIRRKARAADDKITEKEIEARVRIDKEVVKAVDDFLTVNKRMGQLGALKEAFQQRGYVLKEMVALYISNYYGDVNHSASMGNVRKYDDGSRQRARLKEARQQQRH